MISRRNFLKSGGSALAGLPLLSQQPVIYDNRFVPEGAECTVVFASDHHYWPGHLENWGGGGQITTSTDRRMPDLADVLNEERPGLSIHAGDVISAGGSFFPPLEEYTKELAFAQTFYRRLTHPFMPLLGNHETLEALYQSEKQLDAWVKRFGPPYRHHDLKGWRFIGVNCLLPNPDAGHGKGDGFGNVFGLDPTQMDWLRRTLAEASTRGLKTVIATHVPPRGWVNAAEFEKAIVSAGCVKAVLCGHVHRNSISSLGGVPVITRTANVVTPFGYTMAHCYPDGRIILVQKAQHFPLEDFISAGFTKPSPLGAESDRYLTLGGTSQVPLDRLTVIGGEAVIENGHLRLKSSGGRAIVLIDAGALKQGRLTLTAVKAEGERMGGIAFAGADGAGGIEAAVTARYSPDGKVYLANNGAGGREVMARSWFNIGDNIAYRLTLEARNGLIRASWKNMLDLEAPVDASRSGLFRLLRRPRHDVRHRAQTGALSASPKTAPDGLRQQARVIGHGDALGLLAGVDHRVLAFDLRPCTTPPAGRAPAPGTGSPRAWRSAWAAARPSSRTSRPSPAGGSRA